jgi:hypothetical protein
VSGPEVAAGARAQCPGAAKLYSIANVPCSSLFVSMLFLPPGLALEPEQVHQHRLFFYVAAGKVTVNMRWRAAPGVASNGLEPPPPLSPWPENGERASQQPSLSHTEFSACKGSVFEVPLGMLFSIANALPMVAQLLYMRTSVS